MRSDDSRQDGTGNKVSHNVTSATTPMGTASPESASSVDECNAMASFLEL
jgi:hypothetical protein